MNDNDLGFIETSTGYRATDAQIAWWNSRDVCDCGEILEPVKTKDGVNYYRHDCDGPVEWTRES